MSLPLKTAAVITSIFTALLLAMYVLFSELILGEFTTIEKQRISADHSRLSNALQSLESEVHRQAINLSEHIRPSVLSANFESTIMHSTLERLGWSHEAIVLVSLPNQPHLISGFYRKGFGLLDTADSALIHEIISQKQIKSALVLDNSIPVNGYLKLKNEPFIISAVPLRESPLAKKATALIVIAVPVSEGLRSKLSGALGLNPIFQVIPALEANNASSRIEVGLKTSSNEIEFSSDKRDLDGVPILRVAVRSSREIYSKGTAALHKVIFLLGIFLILANYITLLFLRSAVLAPLKNLSRIIKQITNSGNLTLRVNSARSDEIGLLGNSFDLLLKNTEESYAEMLKAQRTAESANSGKSLFIAKVSHELRTPIHCITGMLRILFKQECQAGKKQYIQMAQDSAEGLLSTINEILDFSKMEAGELTLETGEFNLINTIRSCIQSLTPRFEEKHGLELCWDISPGIPESVLGDSHRLRNILTNLIGNAFKFTDRGVVSFKVSRFESHIPGTFGVRFQVADSGIGIPENRLSHIFDPFTQADDSTARLYGGSGLGLAIVKQIVDKMGGSVRVESSIGKGSIFTVEIPFEAVGGTTTGDRSNNSRTRSIALLARHTEGAVLLVEGLERYGIHCQILPPQDPRSFKILANELSNYDLVINSGSIELIADELTPIIQSAQKIKIPFIMSVPSSEMALTDRWKYTKNYFLIQKPIGAIDISLILEGRSIASGDRLERAALNEPIPPLHIIIADDAPTNRIILSNLLEEAGHSVEIVDNGKKLLEKVKKSLKGSPAAQKAFDIIMTDIQMPVMDGFTASQKIREGEAELNTLHPIPIVAVTAYTLPGEAAKMRAAGIDHILTKPISPKKLASLIAEISQNIAPSAKDKDCNYDNRDDDDSDQSSAEERQLIEELCRITERVAIATIATAIAPGRPINVVENDSTIDIKNVFERSGNSLRRTNLILNGFLSAYKDPADWLENTALSDADPSDVRRATHSLKGLLLDVGAVSAAQLAGSLEHQIVTDPQSITTLDFDCLLSKVKTTAVLLESLVEQLPKEETRRC